MPAFNLVETTTNDQLILQGAFFKPKKPAKKALLWIHGLTSNFYADVGFLDLFAQSCEKLGFGFAAFNNRGHDFVTGGKKADKTEPKGYSRLTIGAGNEKFEECIFDISSGVDFLVGQGFTEIILIGHSTGANKVCYYTGLNSEENYYNKVQYPSYVIPPKADIQTNFDKHVKGIILASPISDRLDPSIDKQLLQQNLVRMMKLVHDNKGDQLVNDVFFFPITPNRFLSLFVPNSLEDQFDYGEKEPRLNYFSKIKKPLLVILAGQDEHTDRPIKKIQSIFDQHQHSENYKSIIIPNASHSFDGSEKELVNEIFSWIKSI